MKIDKYLLSIDFSLHTCTHTIFRIKQLKKIRHRIQNFRPSPPPSLIARHRRRSLRLKSDEVEAWFASFLSLSNQLFQTFTSFTNFSNPGRKSKTATMIEEPNPGLVWSSSTPKPRRASRVWQLSLPQLPRSLALSAINLAVCRTCSSLLSVEMLGYFFLLYSPLDFCSSSC